MYDMFNSLNEGLWPLPTACGFAALASGDDEKRLCLAALPASDPKSPRYVEGATCSVISIGGNNEYAFEEAVLAETACSIHTFDCTVKTPKPSKVLVDSGRYTFHKKCLGDSDTDDGKYVRWATMADLAASATKSLALLKMDIEGWEYATFAQVMDPTLPQHKRPLQIEAELHQRTWTRFGAPYFEVVKGSNPPLSHFPDFPNYLRKLVTETIKNVGFRLVDRNDNRFCPHCSEILMVHETLFGINSLDAADGKPAYQLGNKLNFPSFMRSVETDPQWSRNGGQQVMIETRSNVADAYPDSIVGRYRKLEKEMRGCSSFRPAAKDSKDPALCKRIPDRSVLIAAIDEFENETQRVIHPFRKIYDRDDVLAVHLRTGDYGMDNGFIQTVAKLAANRGFKHVRIFFGIHHDRRPKYSSTERLLEIAETGLKRAFAALEKYGITGSYHIPLSPDDDLLLLRRARHIMVNFGTYAIAAAFIAKGEVFVYDRLAKNLNKDLRGQMECAYAVNANADVRPLAGDCKKANASS